MSLRNVQGVAQQGGRGLDGVANRTSTRTPKRTPNRTSSFSNQSLPAIRSKLRHVLFHNRPDTERNTLTNNIRLHGHGRVHPRPWLWPLTTHTWALDANPLSLLTRGHTARNSIENYPHPEIPKKNSHPKNRLDLRNGMPMENTSDNIDSQHIRHRTQSTIISITWSCQISIKSPRKIENQKSNHKKKLFDDLFISFCICTSPSLFTRVQKKAG